MTEPDFSGLAAQHTLGDNPVPDVVVDLAHGRPVELAWRNDLGGLTFRVEDQFVKWNRCRTGIDLERERVRLEWIRGRHPAPRVVAFGGDDEAQWLRSIHAIPVDDFASGWSAEVWVGRAPESSGSRPAESDAEGQVSGLMKDHRCPSRSTAPYSR